MRRTEALASVKFYQILSIFIFFIRLIILEDFIRLISYNGPCVRLGCSFFLATALLGTSQSCTGDGPGVPYPPPPNPIFVFDAVLKIVDSCAGLKEPYQIADQAVAIL